MEYKIDDLVYYYDCKKDMVYGPTQIVGRVLDCSCFQIYPDHKGCFLLENDEFFHSPHSLFKTKDEAYQSVIKELRMSIRVLKKHEESCNNHKEWQEFISTKRSLKELSAKREEFRARRKQLEEEIYQKEGKDG